MMRRIGTMTAALIKPMDDVNALGDQKQ